MSEQNQYGLEKIHKKLLMALDAFDAICRKNGIHYSLHGGTLLGAERNHKLIPWDDDIDVSMTRSEYEKFQKALRCPKGKFYLSQDVLWVSRFVMKTDDENELVWIDIFIWDYISEKKISQFCKNSLLRAVQGMMKTDIEYKRFGFFTKLLLFTTHTVGKLLSNQTKRKLYLFLETKCFLGKKQYIHRSNDGFKWLSVIRPKEYMEKYTDIILEGKPYMVTTHYIDVLKSSYGDDYMTPPPESERVSVSEHERIKNALN